MLPWTEKYRPSKFDDIIGLPAQIPKLVGPSMPNLLFVGPAGGGKTTTARVIAKEMGAQVLELNASDERGIDTVRTKVKQFAATVSFNGEIKIVFLDEADGLSRDAQQVLRNMMEKYAQHCRFILTANYENKIIDPIKSRCSMVEFKAPTKLAIVERLGFICTAEQVKAAPDMLQQIADNTYPDIREAINVMQLSVKDGFVQMVKPYRKVAQEVWDLIQENSYPKLVKKLKEEDINIVGLIADIHDVIMENKDYTTEQKRALLIMLADCNRYVYEVPLPRLEFQYFALKVAEHARK